MQTPQNKQFYEFGAFRLDVRNRLLWRGERAVPLNLKEFEVLLFLVENAGEVVEKDRLLDAIWKDVFIEEGTLARNISRLRKKLEAENGAEKIIETLPKRGYRFLPAVRLVNAPAVIIEEQTQTLIRIEETLTLGGAESERREDADKLISSSNALVSNKADSQKPVSLNVTPLQRHGATASQNRSWLMIGGFVLLAIGAIAFYQLYFRKPEAKVLVASRVAPFSGVPGRENTPAFSPDGKQLAFSWNGGDGDQLDVYVRLVDAGDPVRLTDTQFTEYYPVFSSDGTHIAFVRELKTHGEVLLVPALGGTERRIARLFSGNFSISFAPDGKSIAVIDTEDSAPNKQFAVYTINMETGERKRLTAPAEFRGETTPRFSPDGRNLAFVRVFDDNRQDLFIVPATGGEPRRLTFDQKIIHSLAWSADASGIFFVSFRGSNRASLWRISATGGEPEVISTGGSEITNLAASPDGRTIAFVENDPENFDIWHLTENAAKAKRLVSSIHNEFNPALSPDGSRLVFTSNRSGRDELWMTDTAGKNLQRLTESGASGSTPNFSPDGSRIVFDTAGDQTEDIFVISAEGGAVQRLTERDAARDFLPAWSADGKWIYFTSNRSGENQIWKMSSEGGEAVQITRQGGWQAFPASDGATIFFTKTRQTAELWRVSAGGETEQQAPEFAAAGFAGILTMTRAGIYFLARDSDESFKIKFYDFAYRRVKDSPGSHSISTKIYGNPAASADGKVFLYAQQDQSSSSIMLAELRK